MDDAGNGSTPATGATLTELAEKLSKLREHLDEVVAALNAPRENDGVFRKEPHAATPGPGFGRSTDANGRVCCHECGRLASKDDAGWTLRLCGDDELHAFCPDCDHRYFGVPAESPVPEQLLKE